ncbi:hypothetical protein C490_13800 [Natronobacterium gregoryi SP2]|uniref:Uncharacterized protein n=1 Tax=Natronobacterium gregoryi (strain ATCC 43098 / DSM 3393 / CCM 3738 / CIP 104747 / IAM 13177 / JCM 8860 / NBRC 102187 / NCIMB 2189 / SP2) TaxID=797304 RepID=L9XUS0_NATGS|nr:hypothetical protein C490_13800 [Natronobacterium gregoryi SP2]
MSHAVCLWVNSESAVVEIGVVIRTENKDILWFIGSVVWATERPNVVRFGVRIPIRPPPRGPTDLAHMIVHPLHIMCQFGIANYTTPCRFNTVRVRCRQVLSRFLAVSTFGAIQSSNLFRTNFA